jgi:hypothetical protein
MEAVETSEYVTPRIYSSEVWAILYRDKSFESL